jgi:hypothetical protein
MNIKFNSVENSIEITDRQKALHVTMLFIFAFTLVNSFMNLFILSSEDWKSPLSLFWMFLGVTSMVFLVYFLAKKTFKRNIPLRELRGLKEKKILGNKKYSLELKNGKSRDLNELKTTSQIAEVKSLIISLGLMILD